MHVAVVAVTEFMYKELKNVQF